MSFACRPIGLVKSAFVWRPTISADATNWVLYSQATAAGWDGVVPLDAEVTLGSGIVLSANSTSYYGFDTGSGFPAGTTLKAILPGYVCGMGGAGGNGSTSTPTSGAAGGPALRAQYAITIDALGGVTAGGGGGGGGGKFFGGGGGGGGRTGRSASAGGSNSSGTPVPGSGSFTIGGAGGWNTGGAGGTTGAGADGTAGGGGGGGGWGAAGGAGHGGAAGGAGGAAVVGNAFITWVNSGTRYGSIT